MKLRSRMITIGVLFSAIFISAQAGAGPYPPVNQKRPPLALKFHGIFWAGGEIVNRTQSGTQSAGDLKNIPYNQTQVLTGQAYVEYFIPAKLRNGKNTRMAGKVGRTIFCAAGFRFTSSMCRDAGAPVSCPISSTTSKRALRSQTRKRCFERGTAQHGWNGIPDRCRCPTRPTDPTTRAVSATTPGIRRIHRSIATAI
ncbi:MAG: hypothetical protein E6J73_07490 [Deltaproteobacteria bacterium]|nr:MAG: hypothetical protein E6J73_07490 [Deltaproteobacteria bacterium]